MSRNEEILTVTDENEEKLRSLVEKAKAGVSELFQKHYKLTQEEFERGEYASSYEYGAFEDGVIEGHICEALDLDRSDEKLSALIQDMRVELENLEEDHKQEQEDSPQSEYSMRQIIIARKDLDMSAGKLAAQCCHASEAFLARSIEAGQCIAESGTADDIVDTMQIQMRRDIRERWMGDIFTKTICEAKNRNYLMKAVKIAEGLGLQEGRDFFLIKDCCLTELEPEEIGEDGVGRTLTCIGFRPLPDDVAHAISKKFQLYK